MPRRSRPECFLRDRRVAAASEDAHSGTAGATRDARVSLTAADLGIPAIFNAATRFVDRNVEEGRGEHVAIECGDEKITYSQVLARANRFGSALRSILDVRPEERIVLLLTDGPAFAYRLLRRHQNRRRADSPQHALDAGGLPVRNRRLARLGARRQRVAAAADSANPAVDRKFLRHIVVAGAQADPSDFRLDDLLEAGSAELDAEPTSRDAPAFWLYSSGSTGTPKGCVHLQHDMAVCAELDGQRVLGHPSRGSDVQRRETVFRLRPGERALHAVSVGATTILWPGAPTPPAVYDVIGRHRPTLFYSVPTGYAMMLAQDPPGIGATTICRASGLASRPARRCRPPCTNASSSASASTFWMASDRPRCCTCSSRTGRTRFARAGAVWSCRATMRGSLDDGRAPVARGEIGNLWIEGDSTCACYWNQPDKTRETIEGRWIRTGDKYTQDADGYFWYAGRSDDMLKVGGLWVSPVEVENALAAHEAVLESGVVGREDGDGLTKPLAFVVLREGRPRLARARDEIAAVRARAAGGVQAAAMGPVRCGAAEDGDRQDPALQASRTGGGGGGLTRRRREHARCRRAGDLPAAGSDAGARVRDGTGYGKCFLAKARPEADFR